MSFINHKVSPTEVTGRKCGDSLTPRGATDYIKIRGVRPRHIGCPSRFNNRIGKRGKPPRSTPSRNERGAIREVSSPHTIQRTTMNYNKENSKKALEHLKNQNWGEFLKSLPLGVPCGYVVEKDMVQIIRIRASQIAKSGERTFSINYNAESGVIVITAKANE